MSISFEAIRSNHKKLIRYTTSHPPLHLCCLAIIKENTDFNFFVMLVFQLCVYKTRVLIGS